MGTVASEKLPYLVAMPSDGPPLAERYPLLKVWLMKERIMTNRGSQ